MHPFWEERHAATVRREELSCRTRSGMHLVREPYFAGTSSIASILLPSRSRTKAA